MESRIQHILLNPVLRALGACCGLLVLVPSAPVATAANPDEIELEPLVVREPERREVEIDDLDTEDFEIGINGGIFHFEDFGSDTATSLRVAYHITEDFFVEATYGQSKLGETSFEHLSGAISASKKC